MKIRIGEFGNVVAPPDTGARAPAEAFVQPGLAELGQTAGRVAGSLIRERTQEEERKKAELRGLQRVEAHTGFQADIADYTNGLIGQLAEGKVKLDELDDTFNKQLEEIKKRRLEGLDAESQANVTAHFGTVVNAASAKLRSAADIQRKQDGLAFVNNSIENLHRSGVTEPSTAILSANSLLQDRGPGIMGADKVAGTQQSFAERVWFSHYTDRMVRGRDSAVDLKKLEGEIGANQVMDPDKRSILMGRVAGMQETLAAKAERAARSRMDVLRSQIERVDSMTLKGFEPSANDLSGLLDAAKGTDYEPAVRAQIQFANQTTKFRAAGPREKEAFLTQLEAATRELPVQQRPDAIKTLEAYRSIAKNEQESVTRDPITFAGQKGLATVQPIDLVAAVTDETGLSSQLSARLSIGRGMRSQYGAPLKVLTEQEGRMLTEQLGQSTPQGKTQLFGALSRSLGEDPEGYKAIMNQIRPDDPVTAIGGAYAANRYRAPAGQVAAGTSSSVADLIFAGQQIIHPKKKEDGSPDTGKMLPMPPEKDMRRDWDNYVRDGYAGNEDARSAYYQTAQAIYMKLAVDAGPKDTSILDNNRWKTAMSLATGGVEDYRGRRTPMPWGMPLSDFKDGVSQRAQGIVASGLLDPKWTSDKLLDLPLEPAGERRYVFRSGDGVVVGKDGRPVFVDFDQAGPLLTRQREPARFPRLSEK